jgi:hypothetical protein
VRRLLAAAFVLAAAAPAPAQTPDAPAVVAGVERRRDRVAFHFDNPSSIDTPRPVPHFFEQRYVADNTWALVTARYQVRGVAWTTTAGATLHRTANADDYDTFFDPDGTVWVAGTSGPASMHAWRVEQRGVFGRGAMRLVTGYRLSADRAVYGVGHKTTTRNGVLTASEDVTTRESADALVQEAILGVEAARQLGGWELRLAGEAVPIVSSRLTVRLPDKYPGQDLVFTAIGPGARARATLARRATRWPVELTVEAGRMWSYRSARRMERTGTAVAIAAGRSW